MEVKSVIYFVQNVQLRVGHSKHLKIITSDNILVFGLAMKLVLIGKKYGSKYA